MATRNQRKYITRLWGEKKLPDPEIAKLLGIPATEVYEFRKRNNLLTEEERNQISGTRRKLVFGGLALLASIVFGGINVIDYLSDKKVSHVALKEAIKNPEKRQEYLDTLIRDKKPDEVISVEYATPAVLEDYKTEYGVTPRPTLYAQTVPQEMDKIGRGTKSKIYIFENAFVGLYADILRLSKAVPDKQFYGDLETIISSIIFKNEFTDAKHHSQGIPGFPLDEFKDLNGYVNPFLYTTIIDLLSLSAEHKGLSENPRISQSKTLQSYDLDTKQHFLRLYRSLTESQFSNMDDKFIQKLRDTFSPAKLL
ncbi:hypothetical protein HYX01_04860 [Candidatus Woesearchaeota archaeon]|nr:hypothetical protein [Candidatus Woesearchaeota archaeon]